MAEESVFRGALSFMDKLGVYDVVLPFLLVFTIVFAILEKTKVFGTVKIGDSDYTKKNLNAIVAFVTAFMVVASTKLVAVINKTLANMVLLLMLIVLFLLLIGTFFKKGEEVALEKDWRTFFMFAMFIGIVLIFLDALDWLDPFWDFMKDHWETQWVSSLVLLVVVVLFIYFITKEPKEKGEGKKKEE